MTIQIDDLFRYNDADYAVGHASNSDLFDPAMLNLVPEFVATSCTRGYQAVFTISLGRLVLADLNLSLFDDDRAHQSKPGPVINDVAPTCLHDDFDLFNNHYEHLNFPLDYSGSLLIMSRFLEERFVDMGFHIPWQYERVVELEFSVGSLESAIDCSIRMAEVRQFAVKSIGQDQTDAAIVVESTIARMVGDVFSGAYQL